MKVRNFYPRSAIRKLAGKSPRTLSAGEQSALYFALRKGRKLGVQVVVASSDTHSLEGVSPEQAAAILSNCNTKIFMNLTRIGKTNG